MKMEKVVAAAAAAAAGKKTSSSSSTTTSLSVNNKSNRYDYSFKILLIGDSGVGKSSLLLTFISNNHHHPHLSPTIGVDFKIKLISLAGKRLKLTIWDTAGQERFGTLTRSYYRGAHGIILVYDVTRRETFLELLDTWGKEVDLYSTNRDCIKLVVGNKVDRETERAVTKEEGMGLAQKYKCSFLECSAKSSENVHQCFKDLLYKILEVPSLLEEGSMATKRHILTHKKHLDDHHQYKTANCCS